MNDYLCLLSINCFRLNFYQILSSAAFFFVIAKYAFDLSKKICGTLMLIVFCMEELLQISALNTQHNVEINHIIRVIMFYENYVHRLD